MISFKNTSEITLRAFRETAVFLLQYHSLAALYFRLDFCPKIQSKICLDAAFAIINVLPWLCQGCF